MTDVYTHTEHNIDIKISNDNTKGEKRATIHVRTDGVAEDAIKLAIKLFKESIEWIVQNVTTKSTYYLGRATV